jgi:AcrR family transcriptional regulator
VTGTLSTTATPAAQERTRQIVEAASAVFGRQGYGNTSMKDIAQEAGIAPGLIHYYFGSKEDLVLAVIRTACDQMVEETRASFRAGGAGASPLAKGWASLQAARERTAHNPAMFRLFFEMLSLSFYNPALRRELEKLYEDLTDASDDMVRELAAELPSPMPVPTRDFAAVIVAAIDGLALRAQVDPAFDADALYRALGFILLATASASYAAAGQTPPLEDLISLIAPPGAVDT